MADWHDPNNDGKVYYDEILSNARGSWLDVFDFPGRLDASLTRLPENWFASFWSLHNSLSARLQLIQYYPLGFW
jgi:hypothetical protein